MGIIESLYTTISIEQVEMRYMYRLTCSKFRNGQAFGIEVERQDFVGGNVVKIERDSIKNISCNKEKVRELVNMLYKNTVAPIHLVDIIGEYVDQYVNDFDVLKFVAISL